MAAQEGSPTLNLNKVEAQEAAEHMLASETKVAGATHPYSAGLEGTSGAASWSGFAFDFMQVQALT